MADVAIRQLDHQWQAQQPVANFLRNRKLAGGAAELLPRRRCVEGYVMKDRMYVPLLEPGEQACPLVKIGDQQVVHMGVVGAVGGSDGAAYPAGVFQPLETFVIPAPDGEASFRDVLRLLHLCVQERRDQFPRQV